MLDLFPRVRQRREIPGLNVVPILDLLVCVIFFLLLGTTFTPLTKQSVPPSSVSTQQKPIEPPPLSPQLIAVEASGKLKLILSWRGSKPGRDVKEVKLDAEHAKEESAELLKTVSEMVGGFSKNFPLEKTLRMGLGAAVPYQKLVTIMDGAREKMPDMVLFSYTEAQLRADKMFVD